MKISGLASIFYRPRELATSLRFYRDLLQLECDVLGAPGNPEIVTVRLGGGPALILAAPHGEPPTLERGAPDLVLSLQVEDPDVFARECSQRGVTLADPPHDTHWNTRMWSARDPDGLTLHFERPLEKPRS